MRKLLYTFILSAVSLMLFAQAAGESCEKSLHIDRTYVKHLDKGDFWFWATTYELPVKAYFSLDDPNGAAPELYIDLSCTPGVYSDPKVADLVQQYGISLPYKYGMKGTFYNGKPAYKVEFEASLINGFAEIGVDYPVKVYVHVVLKSPCTITINCGAEVSECMSTVDSIYYGQKISLQPSTEDVRRLPIDEWNKSGFRAHWNGTGSLNFSLANNCESLDSKSTKVLDTFVMGGEDSLLIITPDMISVYNQIVGVVDFYTHLEATSAGTFWLEPYTPTASQDCPYMDNLDINTSYLFYTDNSLVAYTAPVTAWIHSNLCMTWRGKDQMAAYVSNVCDFEPKDTDSKVLVKLPFVQEGDSMVCRLTKKDISALAKKTTDGYLYFRFNNTTKGTFNMFKYEDRFVPCAERSNYVALNTTTQIDASADTVLYRMHPADWAGKNVRMTWSGEEPLSAYVAYECDFELINDFPVMRIYDFAVPKGDSIMTLSLPAEEVSELMNLTDEDGDVYVRFSGTERGSLSIFTYELTCPEISTIILLPDTIDIGGNKASDVFRIRQKEWNEPMHVLSWKGTSSVTAYIADDCQFNLTSANIHVLKTLTFEPNQEHSISNKDMAQMFTRADADGYLYLRFLADNDGTLITEANQDTTTCLGKTQPLALPSTFESAGGSNVVYRLDKNTLQNHDVTFDWQGQTSMKACVANTCEFTSADPFVLATISFSRGQSRTIPSEQINALCSKADDFGCLYLRIENVYPGTLAISSTAIEIPVDTTDTSHIIPTPCVERSIPLALGASVALNARMDTLLHIQPESWKVDTICAYWNGTAPLSLSLMADCNEDAFASVPLVDSMVLAVEDILLPDIYIHVAPRCSGNFSFAEWHTPIVTPKDTIIVPPDTTIVDPDTTIVVKCEDLAQLMYLPDTITVPVGGDFVWMFNAEAWKVNDIDFAWVCNSIMTAYINASCYDAADDATSLALLEFDANETITKTSAELGKIAEGVDTYAYIRFGDNKLPGKLRISIHEPAALDNVISELTADTMVEVYTVAGQQVYSGTYGNMSLTRGIYLIHTATQTLKVVR